MQITVNGTTRNTPDCTTLADLLTELDLTPQRVAIEVNEDLVPRKRFAETMIRDGDRIEIVTFVGGG